MALAFRRQPGYDCPRHLPTMIKPILRSSPAAWLALAAALACGCTRQPDPTRHLEAAERHFAAGDLAAAEIEFRNVLQAQPDHARALARTGEIWLLRGAPREAAGALARASELTPDDPAVRTGFSRALLLLGYPDDARGQAAAALKLAPASGEALLLLVEAARTPESLKETREQLARVEPQDQPAVLLASALLEVRQGNLDEGERALRRVLDADPRSARAQMLLGQLEWNRNHPAEAEKAFRAARELAPPRSPEATGLALFLSQTGRRKEAMELLREQTAGATDFLPAWRLLARVAWEDKDRGAALAALDRVSKLCPLDLEAGLLKAEILIRDGQADEAAALLERIRSAYPPNPALEVQLARACIAGNKAAQAATALDRAIDLNPQYPDAVVLRATLRLTQGDAAGAIPPLEEFLARQPQHRTARLLLVDALRAAGRLEEAAALLSALAAEAEDDFRPHFHLGSIRMRQGRLDDARQAFEKAQQLAPDNLLVTAQLVAIDLAEKIPDDARRRVDAQLARQPDGAQAHYLSGLVFDARGMRAEAEQAMRKAVDLDPSFLAAYGVLVRLQATSGRSEEALADLRRILAKNPGNLAALIQLGMIQQSLGRNDEAAAAFQQVLDRSPDFVPALNNLAVIRSEAPDGLDKARELATRARTLAPEDGSVTDTLGWIQYQAGEFTEALTTLQQAAERLPAHPVVQFHLAAAAAMAGDVQQARDALAKALAATAGFPEKDAAARLSARLDEDAGPPPGDPAAIAALEARVRDDPRDVTGRIRLGRALAAAGRHPQAAEAFQQALAANPDLAAAHLGLAELFAGPLNDPAKALQAATRARELAPADPAPTILLGRAAFRAGDHQRAHALLTEATAHSADPAALHDLAWAAYALGRVAEARTTMQRALDAAAGGAPGLPAGAQAFLDLTDPGLAGAAHAAERIAAARAADPDNVPALMAAGGMACGRRAWDEAAAAFRRVLEVFPGFAPARVALAGALLNDPDKLAEAQKLALEARKLLADDPELTSVLARINFRQDAFEDAAQLLRELAARRPLAADESFALGVSLAETGHPDEARAPLEQALASGLAEPDAARATTVLERLRGK